MSTSASTKIPRLKFGSPRRFESAVVKGTTAAFTAHHRKNIKTHKLPGIGTYVIDTPKDSNLSARQKCFRYQEIHRGVSRSKLKKGDITPETSCLSFPCSFLKTLPDIPKRYDMKTLPVAKLRELRKTDNPPYDEAWRETTTPNVSENGSNDDSRSERSRKQDTSWKLPSQEELVSRSPIGRMEASITGFGLRKNKQQSSLNIKSSSRNQQHREFTYLSTNLALSEPEPVMVKATERELESQAEYRKQLTFYLSQMLNSASTTPQPNDTKRDGIMPSLETDDAANNNSEILYDYDYVGYSSKNLNWECNLRLGDMLINTTPDLRKKLKLDDKPSRSKDGSDNKKVKKHLPASNDNNNSLSKNGKCNDVSSSKLKESARSDTFLSSHSHNSHQSFQIAPSSSTNIKRSNSFVGQQQQPEDNKRRANVTVPAGSSNKIEIVHIDEDGEEYDDNDDDSDDDDDDMEKWREVVNLPVVESGGYDRYANVKLPPWGRINPRGNEHKQPAAPSHTSRNTVHTNVMKGGSVSGVGKHTNSPSGLS